MNDVYVWQHTLETCDCPPNNDPFLPAGCQQGYGWVIEADGQVLAGGFPFLSDALHWQKNNLKTLVCSRCEKPTDVRVVRDVLWEVCTPCHELLGVQLDLWDAGMPL